MRHEVVRWKMERSESLCSNKRYFVQLRFLSTPANIFLSLLRPAVVREFVCIFQKYFSTSVGDILSCVWDEPRRPHHLHIFFLFLSPCPAGWTLFQVHIPDVLFHSWGEGLLPEGWGWWWRGRGREGKGNLTLSHLSPVICCGNDGGVWGSRPRGAPGHRSRATRHRRSDGHKIIHRQCLINTRHKPCR